MFIRRLFVHSFLGTKPYPQPPRQHNIKTQTKKTSSKTPKSPNIRASSLEDLASLMRLFDHPLKDSCKSFVFSDGTPGPIMLIGEAPGAQEDLQGKPFVGKSGQLLTRMFETIGYTRQDLYITNIIPWRPPDNRTPTADEIGAFQPFVKEHVRLANPQVVILVGNTPLQAFFGTSKGGITRARGQWFTINSGKDFLCTAVFHPAYLLRNPSKKKEFWFDLLSIQEKIKDHSGTSL